MWEPCPDERPCGERLHAITVAFTAAGKLGKAIAQGLRVASVRSGRTPADQPGARSIASCRRSSPTTRLSSASSG